MTVAHLCLLVACGGGETTPGDARASCAETAVRHDEDGDGFFDACDNCPAIANNQADTTEVEVRAFADGVGDACDPRPGAGGDDLRAFYSFASEAQATAWTGSGFTISDDELHATGAASWSSTRAATGDGVLVLAQIASLGFGATGELAITLDGDGIGSGAICSLGAQVLTAREVGGATSSVSLASAIGASDAVTLIAWRTVVLRPSGRAAEITCRVTHGGDAKDVGVMLTDDLVSGSHAIAVQDASADLTSLSVYTSPGPKNP